MKHLLAYLFIVLGISITLNSSASAKIVFCEIIFITFDNKVIKAGESGSVGKKYDVEPVYFNQDKCFFASGYMGQNKIDHPQINFKKYVEKLTNYKMRKGSSAAIIGTGGSSVKVDIARSIVREFEKNKFNTSYLISVLEGKYRIPKKYLEISKKTIIAKAEETKQEKNNSLNYKARICAINLWDSYKQKNNPNKYEDILIFKDRGVSCSVMMNRNTKDLSYKDYLKILEYPEKYYISDKYSITKGTALTNSICLNKKNKIHNLKPNCEKNSKELYVVGGNGNYLYLSESSKNKITIVAKKVIKDKKDKNILDIKFCYGFGSKNDVFPTLDLANCWLRLSSYEAFKRYKPNKNICYNKKSHLVTSLTKCYPENEIYYVKYNGKNFIIDTNKTKIAKKVPEKNNEDIVKLEEHKQEEFKPENKDIDNDAPVIEIAQNIIVSDTSYVIEGKVSDKSDKIFVEIDGQPIEVKKGKFKANRYSPVDEQIKIVAIDQWGNKSKPKLVNIKIKLDETAIAEKLEPLNPSNIKTKSSKNKIAIIIGIENYSEAPKANYANLDAQYFFDYARRAFGVKKQNINLLINEDATVVKTDKALSLWLKSKIKKNRSELIIFFAGHGLASTDGKELYLLPQDGNPDRLKRTALSRTDLFREIIELNPKNVTMFLDTCFSGVSRDEEMLLASARPLRIIADEQEGIPDNFTIFSASKLDQISSGLTEVNHGIFSYYLMKGLEGYADFNEDKKITNGELLAYMDENVSQKAAEQGREQNPSLAGDPNKVLVSFN